MDATKRQARYAGLMYLLLAIVGPIGLIYVPTKLLVTGDASATAERIMASQGLLRIGIASELLSSIIFIFVGLALYRLFKDVDRQYALLMLILVLVSIPMSFLNVLNELAALILYSGADFLSPFNTAERESLAYVFLRLHSQGFHVIEIFWGLWLFPFGMLVIRSGFIPRVLGMLLVINCFAYLAMAFINILLPQHSALVSRIALLPMAAGELSIIIWLLVWGAKAQKSAAPAR